MPSAMSLKLIPMGCFLLFCEGIPGKTGPKGDPGARGVPGKTGLTGTKGMKGEFGNNGTNGRMGLPGKLVRDHTICQVPG